jgi:hypothetical protein
MKVNESPTALPSLKNQTCPPEDRIVWYGGGMVVTQQDLNRPKQFSKRDFDRLDSIVNRGNKDKRNRQETRAMMRAIMEFLKK